ncbi:MAG: bifunctional phosphoglucose/phosphomannose isomerase [Saprospiraceae bacterium]|nr:bifunctional phosphoglucose/phosphomannose isomerase [Saprospiraceae bacterium]MDW8483007.1 bifunctional phosphoglucose/phosphomannose isomerase [Saprospiraceae bacterium]
MEDMIARFPDQLEEALSLARSIAYREHPHALRQVLISGMGGSGIGGNFVQELTAGECKALIWVNKGYDAPHWVDRHTLAICSSYSGNTEETLSVFEQSTSTGAKVVCIASGGQLLERARARDFDVVALPSGWSSPRACLGYSIVAQLGVLHAAQLIGEGFFREIEAARQLLVKEQDDIRERARKLAGFLADKLPVLYCADGMEAVALRWRQQINENAKMLCWHHVVPEMNHNELVGWHNAQPHLAVIWLRQGDDSLRIAARMDIVQRIIRHYAAASIEVFSKGKTRTERKFYLIHLGDWVSFYLAQERRVDPVEIRVIDYLKAELAKIG